MFFLHLHYILTILTKFSWNDLNSLSLTYRREQSYTKWMWFVSLIFLIQSNIRVCLPMLYCLDVNITQTETVEIFKTVNSQNRKILKNVSFKRKEESNHEIQNLHSFCFKEGCYSYWFIVSADHKKFRTMKKVRTFFNKYVLSHVLKIDSSKRLYWQPE